jgi:hypothetical protein
MSNIKVKLEELNALPAVELVENASVEAKFVQMYNAIHGNESGINIYRKEAFNFQKVLREKPEVAACSKFSLFGCFTDIAINGLSLDPTGHPHCYLIPRSVKTGYRDANGKDIYEKRASLSVTGYGELLMRMRAGQIKYADNPVIVYEGDTFGVSLNSGQKQITYSAAIPRKSNKIIAAFIRIVRNDGSEDYQWMLSGDITRLKGYSEKANQRWDANTRQWVTGDANALYTSQNGGIDPGFLEAKMIKHAFDAYPKVRIGKFSNLETEDEPQDIDYGIEESALNPPQSPLNPPQGDLKTARQPFGADRPEPPTAPKTLIITPQPEDEDIGF